MGHFCLTPPTDQLQCLLQLLTSSTSYLNQSGRERKFFLALFVAAAKLLHTTTVHNLETLLFHVYCILSIVKNSVLHVVTHAFAVFIFFKIPAYISRIFIGLLISEHSVTLCSFSFHLSLCFFFFLREMPLNPLSHQLAV